MSRRRGWEDAYLDYQSLRLLLTQIEAVYEEEDWKRGGGGGGGTDDNNNAIDGIGGDGGGAADLFDDLDDDFEQRGGGVATKTTSDGGGGGGVGGGWGGLWKNARRSIFAKTTGSGGGGGGGDGGGGGRPGVRQRQRGGGRDDDDDAPPPLDGKSAWETTGSSGGWVSNDYYDYYSPDERRPRLAGRRKKDKDDRALDRGGWRSPGVTDYRDELFLVSDEDVAYGVYCEEEEEEEEEEDANENTADEDTDDWEEEEIDGDIHGDRDDADDDDRVYDNDVSIEYYEVHIAAGSEESERGGPPMSFHEASRSDSKPMSEKSAMMEDDENAGDGGERDGGLLPQQILYSHKSSEVISGNRRQQQAAQHFGSGGGITKGGMLEAGYETFAAAAARSGFVGGGGGAGSPSEERGWLNFIPNLLLSRGGSAQQQKSHASVSFSEIDPLCMRPGESSNPDLPPSINRVDDSSIPNNATRYTHFADTFHTRHSSSASFDVQNPPLNDRPISSLPDLSEEMTDVDSIGVDNDFGRMESVLAIGSTTPKSLFSTFKSFPVHATAVGGMMPTTPNTPVFERPKEVKNGTFIGGFGVSVNMIPTESTELLHPSPGEHSSHANAGTSQFYSFHNNYKDGYPSKNNANNAAYSTLLNDLGQSGEYDGGDEEERTSSNNMISFYSGEGANEGFRYVRSPSKASRRQHSSQKHPENTQHSPRPPSGSSTKEPIADSGGGNFILSLLFGNSRDSILNNMTVSSQAPASQSRGAVGSSSGGGGGDRRRRPGSRQRRAAAAAKRKQARLRKQRRLRRQNERVPRHLRLAHQRAAAITER
jgi:hypothetical protein